MNIDKEVKEILKNMQGIEYGYKDKNGDNIIKKDKDRWDSYFQSFYHLQSPEELIKTNCGVCFDQVELERKLFGDKNIKCNTYFLYISDGKSLPSHTFLVFSNNGNFYWFESSWYMHRGIHEYNSLEDLFKDVIIKFKDNHKEISKEAKLYLYEYDKPKYNITCNDFYKYIETQKLIIEM